MRLTMSLIKADIIAAGQAIDYYNSKHIKDIKNIAAYHIQQAAEKLLKIQIYVMSDHYDNAAMFNHNLDKLILYAESLDIQIVIPQYIADNSGEITSWEAGSRYDVGFKIRIDVLQRALTEVEKWYSTLYAMGIRSA